MVSAATGVPRQHGGAGGPLSAADRARAAITRRIAPVAVSGAPLGRPSPRPAGSARMPLPEPRGPLSAELIAVLTGDDPAARGLGPAARQALRSADVLADEDLQLYLTLSYELHYRGIAGVSDSWEWNPALLLVRSLVERVFEAALRAAADADRPLPADPDAVVRELQAMTRSATDRSLAAYLADSATADQLREFLIVRSAARQKRADPQAFVVPRLAGAAKAAMAAMVQGPADGQPHQPGEPDPAARYADAMRALDLDSHYGAQLDRVPAVALVSVNAMSLFALHRRLSGAMVGHAAAQLMTSAAVDHGWQQGLLRLDAGDRATGPLGRRPEVDQRMAGGSLAGDLAADQPGLIADLMFGARACLVLQEILTDHLLNSWQRGGSALR